MLTSHSAGIQYLPFTLPAFNVSVDGALAPGSKPSVFNVFQLVVPAMPFSLPHHLKSGPTSLNTTVLGDRRLTVSLNRFQSYTCFFRCRNQDGSYPTVICTRQILNHIFYRLQIVLSTHLLCHSSICFPLRCA